MEDEVTAHAKALYYKHLGISPSSHDYMWGQCSHIYRAAWCVIAEEDLEC